MRKPSESVTACVPHPANVTQFISRLGLVFLRSSAFGIRSIRSRAIPKI
jgi:hypothetical protein